jgi:hypothetical protein
MSANAGKDAPDYLLMMGTASKCRLCSLICSQNCQVFDINMSGQKCAKAAQHTDQPIATQARRCGRPTRDSGTASPKHAHGATA